MAELAEVKWDYRKTHFSQFCTCVIMQVYLDQNDKIVAVSTNIDLVQYFGKTSKVYFEQFEILQKYGLEL